MITVISRFVTIACCVLGFSMLIAAQQPQPQADLQAKQELSEKFKANARTDHAAAYKAAKEYLRRFPDDDNENAQFMKRWVAAYEKVAAKDKEATPAPSAPKAAEAAVTTPSFAETAAWLQEKLSTYGSVTITLLKDGKPKKKSTDEQDTLSNKVVDIGNCTATIETIIDIPGTNKILASRYSDKYTVPLSSSDPDRIEAWTTNQEQIKYNSDRIPRALLSGGYLVYPETKENKNYAVLLPSSTIRIHIKGDAKLIDVARRTRLSDQVGTESFAVGSVQLFFSDQEIAKRAAVAFSNAIRVCQEADKKNPF